METAQVRSEAKGNKQSIKTNDNTTISFGELLLACAYCGGACAGRGCGGWRGGVGKVFDKITNEEGSNCNRVNEEN